MAILNDNSNDRTAHDFVKEHKRNISAFFTTVIDGFRQLGNQFWHNDEFNPVQIAEAYGKDGAELFRLSKAMQDMLSEVTGQPLQVMPDYYDITFNTDGSVTLALKPMVDPPAPAPPPDPLAAKKPEEKKK